MTGDHVLKDLVTTALDLAGLLLLAAGAGFAMYPLIGWPAVGCTGIVLLAGSRVIMWVATPNHAPRWWRKLARKGGVR